MNLSDIVAWFSANGASIVAALGAIIIAARLIVKLTPTPADDTFLEKVVDFLKHVGLQVKDDPKP